MQNSKVNLDRYFTVQSERKERIKKIDLSVGLWACDNVPYKILKVCIGQHCKVEAGGFVLCTRGTIRMTIHLIEYILHENDLAILLPHGFVHIHEMSQDASVSIIGFSSIIVGGGEYFEAAYSSFFELFDCPVLPLSPTLALFVRNMIFSWVNISQVPEMGQEKQVIKDIMLVFLHFYISMLRNKTSGSDDGVRYPKSYQATRNFIRLAMQYYHTEHKISFYADKLGLSVPNLCRFIKIKTQKTPLSIIVALIMTDAETQLKSTDRSITDISHSLGFSNSTAFCRFFRKYSQMSPLEYRNKR